MMTAVSLQSCTTKLLPSSNNLKPSIECASTNITIQQLKSSASVKRSFTSSSGASADDNLPQLNQKFENQQSQNFLKKWREKSAQMSTSLAKLGLAAVLAYGLFDAFTCTTFFVLAFLGYEKSTGY